MPPAAPSKCPIRVLLEELTGIPIPFPHADGTHNAVETIAKSGLGYSQLNEILLSLGYPRVSDCFFQFLVDGHAEYTPGACLNSVEELRQGIHRFRLAAMLRFGNIRDAFNYLRTASQDELAVTVSILLPYERAHYRRRHQPMHEIEVIPGEETYCLGYLVKAEMDGRLAKNPNDQEAKAELAKREKFEKQGMRNHLAYLASDHMDVYVATSMRAKHEYYFVHKVATEIFKKARLKDLKLRWFDPTQAVCPDRIDKGLCEGLMLKRARCTLYFAQESDTLGKDSELASTLAQGKAVIAFVPEEKDDGKPGYAKWLMDAATKLDPGKSPHAILCQLMQVFAPNLAWEDPAIRKWIENPKSVPIAEMQKRFTTLVRATCEKRARMLKEDHPLGLQVALETGVANGVLVARTTDQAAELIERVVLNTLDFSIEPNDAAGKRRLLLREKITDCVFRVVSGDAELTNSFWNFYLRPYVRSD